jgi:hypothetical protein
MNLDDPSMTEAAVIDILSRTQEPIILQRDGALIRLTLPGRASWNGHRSFSHPIAAAGMEHGLRRVLERASAAMRAERSRG